MGLNDIPLSLAPPAGARKSNLAFGLVSLPPDRKRDALVFYAFCRAVDDIADDPARSPADKRTMLGEWKEALQSGRRLPPQLEDVLDRRRVSRSLMLEIVLGVEMDIEPRTYETYEDLRQYCWRVACAVGLASVAIFGCKDPRSRAYAEHLGYALQLTNIIRDVAEDALMMGRIYLPSEDLRNSGVSSDSILSGRPNGDFNSVMRLQASRARDLFQAARRDFPSTDAKALMPAETMRLIYTRLLSRIEAAHFDVFSRRCRVPTWEKLLILAYAQLRATSRRVGIT